jgi:predicted acetyltransferase
MMDINARRTMYMNYVKYMRKLCGTEFDIRECLLNFEKVHNRGLDDVKWIPVMGDGEEVGFFLIGTAPNCHPDADFYIEDAYIIPERRRKGYMETAIHAFIKDNPGKYCLFIVDNNKVAKKVWPRIFANCGYAPLELDIVTTDMNGMTQYAWQPAT